MIKDKLEKCTDNPNNISIKEETGGSCDSTSKDTVAAGSSDILITKKDDDVQSSSTSSTASVKESPGNRNSSSNRSNNISNANTSGSGSGATTNGNVIGSGGNGTNVSAANTSSGAETSDVGSILDSSSNDVITNDETDRTNVGNPSAVSGTSSGNTGVNSGGNNPLSVDLQNATDTFNEAAAAAAAAAVAAAAGGGANSLTPNNVAATAAVGGGMRQQTASNTAAMMQQHIRPSPNGIQPLVSNMINTKNNHPSNTGGGGTTGNMEVQYMQQQSQIFVFSTMLANKSAEAVFQGHFQSIIAYHCAQPGTKKYFEKHPLKLTQFHRQSPAQWLNGLAMMKNKSGGACVGGRGGIGPPVGGGPPMGHGGSIPGMGNFPPKPSGGPVSLVDSFPSHDGIVDEITSLQDGDVPWDQRGGPNHQMGVNIGGSVVTNSGGPGSADGIGGGALTDSTLDDACLGGGVVPVAPNGSTTNPNSVAGLIALGHSPCIGGNTAPTSPSLAGLEPSLQGVKVPDEDLTPQQRQHREEQLATLRKMQQMLFPEENTSSLEDHEMVNANDVASGGPPSCQGLMSTATAMSGGGHMEWQKLQNQFFDNKLGKTDGPMSGNNAGGLRGPPIQTSGGGSSVLSPQVPGGSGTGPRLQGPPPPYHQTPRSASVPIALQSPNPTSPNNPTSNLSLPSPRTSSALNSPADSSGNQRQSSLPPPQSQQTSQSTQQQPTGFTGLNRHFNATQQSPSQTASQSSPSSLVTATASTVAQSLPSVSASAAGSTRPTPTGANTISNPSTPISSHFSPSAPSSAATDSLSVATAGSTVDYPPVSGNSGPTGPVTSAHHGGVDGMFCRTLQSMAQKQHMVSGVAGSSDITASPNKEPNLMPVPSPQQIQYCNTFEGQELTIQKQPNTSLKDRNITSPVSSLDSGFPGDMCSAGGNSNTRVSAPNTPLTPVSMDMTPRFPPINTPSGNPSSDCYRLPAPSPSSVNSLDSKNTRPSPQSMAAAVGKVNNSSDPNQMRFSSNTSPMDGSGQHNRYPMMTTVGGSPNNVFAQQQSSSQSQTIGPKGSGPNMMTAVSPSSGGKTNSSDSMSSSLPTSGQRADNVPLNPNSNNGLPANSKGSHFDPISSLAQMSQLLTSNSSLNGQSPGPGPSMLPYGGVNASAMDMGRADLSGCGVPDMDGGMMSIPGGPHSSIYNSPGMGSPKNLPFMSPQRIMRPNMGPGPGPMPPYNGTNVQVKASAPNTIQYLPARPQMGPTNPRGPPSLDFLRFANPNMDGKVGVGPQNMQYFPSCGPNNNMPPNHMEANIHNDNIMASLMNGPMMSKMGPMSGGMVPQGMMPMGMGGPNLRNPGGPTGGGLRPGMNTSIRMHSGGAGGNGMGGNFDPSGLGGDTTVGAGMYGSSPAGHGGGPQMFGGPNMVPKGNAGGPMVVGGRGGMCGAPDASQPLPPSVGQANAYKNSPFSSGATTADPNYAQQFHNFQQQLYATSTRSQLNSQGPGPPGAPGTGQPQPSQGAPGGNNHMYFMSK